MVNYKYNEETDMYDLYPTDDEDIIIASVHTEEEASGLSLIHI